MKSSHNSQSNPTIPMTSHRTHQSAINTTRAHYYQLEPSLAMPAPTYHHIMPYIPAWTRYDYLSSNNGAWWHPSLDNPQLQTFPREGERLLHTGICIYLNCTCSHLGFCIFVMFSRFQNEMQHIFLEKNFIIMDFLAVNLTLA